VTKVENEIWKPIFGYERFYEVSNLGRVRSLDRFIRRGKNGKGLYLKKGRILKLSNAITGKRLRVNLSIDGKYETKYIHRLVLETFVGPCHQGFECCHNDGNYKNNCVNNLRWDSHQSNIIDRVEHGTSNRGERCGTSKLTQLQVNQIRHFLDSGKLKNVDLANQYNVSNSLISMIKHRKRWEFCDG